MDKELMEMIKKELENKQKEKRTNCIVARVLLILVCLGFLYLMAYHGLI